MNKMKWVLVDTSWLGHRARYTLKGLTHNDIPTGVIYGFLESLRSACFDPRVGSNIVALMFDSKYSVRKMQFPDYKRKRKETRTPEEIVEIRIMHDQLNLLRTTILPDIGFPIYLQSGMETDDLMARAALLKDPDGMVMITADKDLYQCATGLVHWFDPSRDLYLDEAGITAQTRVPPGDWAYIKSLAGCDGDGVPGIPGVGEKTATDYLWKLLPAKSKRYQAIVSPEGQAIIERNAGLVTLPHPDTAPFILHLPNYNPDAFFQWGEKLGLGSYLMGPRRVLWEKFFNGDMSNTRIIPRKRGQSK